MKFNSIIRNLILAIFIALTATITIAFTACVQSPQREEEKGEPQQLTAPANFSIVDEKLCWDEVENADYYAVRYSNYEKRVSVNSFSLSDLSKSNITFRIRACSNNERYLSSEWVTYNYIYVKPEQPTQPTQPTQPFNPAEQFKYTLLEDGSGYEVAKGNLENALAGNVIIPDFYNGLPVKSIARSAFVLYKKTITGVGTGYKKLNSVTTSVQLPAHLETIGDAAFQECIALTSVTLPDTVTSIGSMAFEGCIALTEINIPASVTSIGSAAFNNCVGISRFELPENLQLLDLHAFQGTAWYKNQPDGFVTIRGDILYGYKGEMAEGTVIDKLPSNIKYLAGGVFQNCKQLVSIDLTGIKILGRYAFANCEALKNVTLPSDITEIPEFTFSSCTALETFTIPEGVTYIGKSAFAYCKQLKKIIIPSTVKTISDSAFPIDIKQVESSFVYNYYTDLYYNGTKEQWHNIEIEKEPYRDSVVNFTKYFYSESEPADDGNYWHYVDGEAVAWSKE